MATFDRDPQLWREAKSRARFKSHLLTYVLVNALLWAIWYLTGHDTYGTGIPWPAWATLFWGLGVAIQGLAAYGFRSRHRWAEQEYEQLLRERQQGRP
jgi:hypothetical protein